ncbi:hypothetical protein ACSBR1_016219 [Camellia fascicularis]
MLLEPIPVTQLVRETVAVMQEFTQSGKKRKFREGVADRPPVVADWTPAAADRPPMVADNHHW